MSWDSIAQGVISALAAGGLVAGVFRFYVERRIEESFARKLEEHKASLAKDVEAYKSTLAERSQVRVADRTQRLDGYKELLAQTHRVTRCVHDLYDSGRGAPPSAAELMGETTKLEGLVYGNAAALEQDRLYVDMHTWKNGVLTIAGRLDNAAKLESIDPSRAVQVRQAVIRDAEAYVEQATRIVAGLGERIATLADSASPTG